MGNYEKEFCYLKTTEKEISFDEVFAKFKILLENENLAWIDYLKWAEDLQPTNQELLQYLLYYARAIEDENMVRYYEEMLATD